MFDLKYKRLEWKYLKLATEVLAIMFLKKANITRTEKLLILAGMEFENMPAFYEQAKKALIKSTFQTLLMVRETHSVTLKEKSHGIDKGIIVRGVYNLIWSC